jgi:flagellar biosynthetic protein FlhB
MSGDRTERASPRKRQKAAEKGDQVHSRDLVSAVAMLAGVLALGAVAERWAGQWISMYQAFLALGESRGWQSEGVAEKVMAIRQISMILLFPMMILFAAVTVGALLANMGQSGGVQWKADAFQWKWQRINPSANIRNLISSRSMARLIKSLFPAGILLFFAIRKISDSTVMPPLGTQQLPGMFTAAYAISLDTAWILFGWSAVDYFMEWRSWESRQKMSKQEVREEHRQNEGSPQIRGKIKSLRRQMRRRQLKADVRRASVVITNPAHYAVALSFSFETMEPPKMLAKGRDILAAQIKEEARWAGVPIVENPPLARTLYRHLEPGQAIPYNLYAAVAAILAYLYRQRVEGQLSKDRASRSAPHTGYPTNSNATATEATVRPAPKEQA